MPGPPPTPTHILKLHGSDLPARKGKRGRKQEPKPEKKAPPCPRRLSKEERAVWKDTVPLLQKMGVLTVADGAMIELYCRIWVEERELSVFLKEHGSKLGVQQAKPEVKQREEKRVMLLKIMMQFGMSSASRTHLTVEASEEPPGVTTRQRRKA